MLLKAESGALLGAVPLYAVKNHSYGEYVFDWGWADAYERAGGATTPVARSVFPSPPRPARVCFSAIPPTPIPSAFSAKPSFPLPGNWACQGLHLTFPEKAEFDVLGELDSFEQRLGRSTIGMNADYASFDDFLGALNSRKRKAIRKERRDVAALDIDIRTLSGSEMTEALWDAFFAFYLNTSTGSGCLPLTRKFFPAHDAPTTWSW